MRTYLKSILAIIVVVFCACEKDPTFRLLGINDNATKVSNITATSAEVTTSIVYLQSGDYHNDRHKDLEVYYSTSSNPFIDINSHKCWCCSTTTPITYTATLSNLEPGTTYYYAPKFGNQKGKVRSFTTKGVASISVTTGSVTNITTSSAILFGSCTLINDAVLQESGILLHITSSVSYSNYTKRYSGTYTELKAEAKDLASNTTYYYCAYAIDDKGNKYYGDVKSFTTQKQSTRSAKTAVDLGLSVKWAAGNVGATDETGYGDYFAWGETSPKSVYEWSTYRFCLDNYDNLIKYCTNSKFGTVDNKTILEPADDAAHVNWGGNWRIPTKAEQDELRNNCTWTWTTLNGVNGYLVKSKKNSNSIFLPASDNRYGFHGRYWSSSLDDGSSPFAYCFYFNSDNVDWYVSYGRCYGQSVRPVCP